jgi:hypothetical protein
MLYGHNILMTKFTPEKERTRDSLDKPFIISNFEHVLFSKTEEIRFYRKAVILE